jgi:ribosomal protein L11 methyltransferase
MPPGPSPRHNWVEIAIRIDPVAHEAVSAILFDLGCTGVTTEDFGDGTLKAYFPAVEDLGAMRKGLEERLHDLIPFFEGLCPPEIECSHLNEEDWGSTWRRFFRTEQVTGSLTVTPAWEPVPETDGGITIRMDPGPAFGTGQHPTTRLCLGAMETIPRPDPWTLLDVGTGSGILAVYGAKLGAGKVVAMDIDPEAVRWAGRNVRLNGLEGNIHLSAVPLDQWKETFFMVTANLILGTILDLMPYFPRVVEPDGWLILSGLLRDQVERVKSPLVNEGLTVYETLFQKEWAAVLARKLS